MQFQEQAKKVFDNKLLALIAIGFIIHNILLQNKRSEKNIKLDKRIQFNLDNQEDVETFIVQEIQNRISMLKTSTDTDNSLKLSYNDWIKFNNESPFIYMKGQDLGYFLQVWRNIPDSENDNFILHVYPDKKLLFYTWEEFYERITEKNILTQDEPGKKLIKSFFTSGMKPYGVFKYAWFDPEFNGLVQRQELVFNYDDGFGNKGTISSGFTVRNLEEEYTFDHSKTTSLKSLHYGSIVLTIILTLLIYFFNIQNPAIAMVKAMIFYIIFMSYITYYMMLEDQQGSIELELKKLENISQGVLSMSFMTALSIFILDKLKENSNTLYRESKFLLVVYMVVIIGVLFKNNAYIETSNVTSERVFKEFIFNYCILINMFIVINFGIDSFYIQKSL